MRSLIILFIALLPSLAIAQYQYLGISNPDNTWNSIPVDIHESVFEIHPKGTFSEVELFISFSASEPGYFSENELLEMFAFFELDDQITVSDLWLWWGDQLMIAHIIDRWTANRVYESIVDRQQDPAILYKDSPTSYELRVYPFSREQIRKLKISFLIPNEILETKNSISLPMKFHELAGNVVEGPVIRYFSEDADPDLSLSDDLENTFTPGTDSLDRSYWQTELDPELITYPLNLSVGVDTTSDVFVSNYSDSTGQYYSLSFLPKNVLDVTVSKKVAVLFDYAGSNISISKANLLNEIRTNLKANFEDIDYFNFLYSTVSDQVSAEDWLPATDANIDSVFDAIDPGDILSVSNLDDILVGGIDFINETGTGDLLLISSSDSYHDFQDANSFSESILNYVGNDFPKITILDVQNQNYEYNYRNGITYLGNDYLYGIFVRESGGELFNHEDSDAILTRLNSALRNLQGTIINYTVHPTFNSGFSYANFSDQNSSKLAINTPYVQVGKYYGELPLTIQFSGSIRDTVFNEQIVVSESSEVDSTLKRFWMGRNIDKLEKSSPSNEEIATIIDYSIENRLMSQYTSFLAILPEDTVLIDQAREEDDGGFSTSTDDEHPDSFEIESVKAYPNPFNPTVNIEVKLSEPWDASNSQILIYNLLGQKVATLNTSQFNGLRSFTVNWDISMNNSHLATGVYLVSIQTPTTNKKIKITYLK